MTRYTLGTVLLLALLGGCRVLDDEGGASHPLEVHLQTGFRADLVRVEIDGALIFEGRAETNLQTGLAQVIQHPLERGRHRIRVQVGSILGAETAFTFEPPLAIGVRFNRELVSSSGGTLGIEYRVANAFTYD